jgi:anti-sigma-K factor RskA
LEVCSGCRCALDRAQQTHNLLRQHAANRPPAELKDQVLVRARAQILTRPRVRWSFWATTAAALLIAAVFGVGLFRTITGDSSVTVPLTATSLAPEAGGEVQAEEVGENLRVKLEVWEMPDLADDEYYEMWYYAEDGSRISCGTFQVGSQGRTTVNLTAPATAKAACKMSDRVGHYDHEHLLQRLETEGTSCRRSRDATQGGCKDFRRLHSYHRSLPKT